MTFSLSVAGGKSAVESLRTLVQPLVTTGQIQTVTHSDISIAWPADSPWIEHYDDGKVLIVLDGRLHNQRAAVDEQAELIRDRYREMGRDVAKGLLGDFVLVVLDRGNRTLLVARDPLGVRPWYQATAGDQHAGTTEMATLCSLPWVDTAVNDKVVAGYLAARTESRGETVYRGIQTLRPGQTWELVDNRQRTFTHHEWDFRPDLAITWEEAAERCRHLLDTAVESRLSVSGQATSQLSGGLDSSSVVGTVAQLGADDIKVGRLMFQGLNADESFFSDAVIEHWGVTAVSSRPWIPTPGEAWELTQRLKRPVPEPHYTMFAGLDRDLLAYGRMDGLTGIGGDDAFVAMSVGARTVSAFQLRQGGVLWDLVSNTISRPRQAWRELIKPTLRLLAPWKGDRYPYWLSEQITEKVRPWVPESVTGVAAIDERIANLTSGYDAAILEKRALVGDESGRRESHPFLDPRFIEGTYGLNPWWPVREGHTRMLQVEAYRDRLPPVVATRRSKVEFSEIFWPQLLDEEIIESMRTGPLAEMGWLDAGGFDLLIANAESGMANVAIPLSRCLSVDRWLRSV